MDIDAFIESHLRLVPQFVALPPGVQGATDFFPDGKVVMKISADLSERAEYDLGAEHLMRTTLAHEAAHVLLHRTLFLKESAELFGGSSSRTELCRDVRFVGSGYTGEWWEWQANRGMGPLLLPRRRFNAAVQELRGGATSAGVAALEQALSERFAVSRQAIQYRLQQLRVVGDPRQKTMNF